MTGEDSPQLSVAQLVAASFITLATELVLIRWVPGEVRVIGDTQPEGDGSPTEPFPDRGRFPFECLYEGRLGDPNQLAPVGLPQ